MSTEKTAIMAAETSTYLTEPVNPTDLFSEELDGLRPTFERIKIPAGGALSYEVPGDEFVSLDNDFHQLLYHYGGYDRVWCAMHNVTTHYDRVRYLDNALNNIDEEEILAEHRQFYNYLRIGVPPASVLHEEFERHLGRFRDGFQHLLDMFPGYFQ